MTSDPKKIVRYSDRDPRYNFMIQDSDEYNTLILPLGMDKICKGNNLNIFSGGNDNYVQPSNPCDYRRGPHYSTRRSIGCSGQRYENCIADDEIDNEYGVCDLKIWNPNRKQKSIEMTAKKLNNNVFYDAGRIPKRTVRDTNIVVDTSPDINFYTANKKRVVPGHIETIDTIENFNDSELAPSAMINDYRGEVRGCVNVLCTPFMTTCCPCFPEWMTPEDTFILCLVICLFIVLFPCIMSCSRSFGMV